MATQDPSTIPASITITNLLSEPLMLAGQLLLPVGGVRVVPLASFLLPQRAAVWNAIYRAKISGWITAAAATFDVTPLSTGHQGAENDGGHQSVGGQG